MDDQSLWWPATVTDLKLDAKCGKKRSGELLYHKLRDYPAVQTAVVSSTSISGQRYVSSVQSNGEEYETSLCSWVYCDEVVLTVSISTIFGGTGHFYTDK